MPLPKKVDFVSLEVYGTLIDWETGIHDAFQKEAEKDGFTIDHDRLIPLFIEKQREIMSGSYELYAEVLRRTAVAVAEELGWELEPVRSSFLPNSIPSWPPFRDTNALLDRLKKKFYDPGASGVTHRPDLEHRRQAARRHAPPPARRLRPRRDRAAGAQLQAGPRPLQGGQAPHRQPGRSGSTSRPASRPT